MSYQYQLIVIGSGSAGQEACLKAAKAGLRTLLVEERTLGSNSFHGGSYAIRALRACANYFKRTEKAEKFGTSLNEPIELPPSTGEDLPVYKLTTGDIIQPDITLVATGRIPNSDELGLESVGLTVVLGFLSMSLCRRRLNRSMLLVTSTALLYLTALPPLKRTLP